jgi:hypothetical protein
LITVAFKVNDVRRLNRDWVILVVSVQLQTYVTTEEVQTEVSDVSEAGSGQALYESRRTGREHVGDTLLVGDGFVER